MTEGQQTTLENEILQAAFSAEKAVTAHRLRLSVIGQYLESLGRALQEHPEDVTRLPEPTSIYDYRKELEALKDGERVIALCNELRALLLRAKSAEKRKGMLTFASRDSAA
jgi:hypothetical protein